MIGIGPFLQADSKEPKSKVPKVNVGGNMGFVITIVVTSLNPQLVYALSARADAVRWGIVFSGSSETNEEVRNV